jgi:hypothetical protein
MPSSPEQTASSLAGDTTASDQHVTVETVDDDGAPLPDSTVNVRAEGFAECVETSTSGRCSVPVPEQYDAVSIYAHHEGHVADSTTVALDEDPDTVTLPLPDRDDC